MNKYIFLIVIATSVLTGCYKDEMITPEPDFEIFIIDSLGKEVIINDQVSLGVDVFFRNKGEGNAYVIWVGERLLSRGFGSYELTPDALSQLQSSNEITASIADAINPLVGIEFDSDRNFKKELGKLISSDELKTFESNILNAAVIPLKDFNGNDSVLFRYNYSYDDFLQANEKGYYNVSGISLDQNTDNEYVAQYKYSSPGKRNVTFQAVGIGNFGEDTKKEIITKTLNVVLKEEK